MAKFVLVKTENIVGKEENAGYQHFLLFPRCFQNTFSLGSFKVGIVWQRVNPLPDNKNLPLTKLKAFADDTLNVTITEFLFYRVENTEEKRHFPQGHQKLLCGKGLILHQKQQLRLDRTKSICR